MMKPEIRFLRYAIPCLEIIKKTGRINKKEYSTLMDLAIEGDEGLLEKEKLKNIFKNAFRNMEIIAENLGENIWSDKVIGEYFLVQHDKMTVSKKNIPEKYKELDRVYLAKVINIVEDKLDVKYLNLEGIQKKRRVNGALVKDIKTGEIVSIHFRYAVEKITPEMYGISRELYYKIKGL